MYDIEVIKNKVKELVNDKRYEHSLLTAKEAKELAMHLGYDPNIAEVVGMAHDIAKDFSDEENEMWVHKYNLDESILDESYRKMIHADIGAVVCKEWFNFTDEMCNAIKYHTVANEEMSLLDVIIFIADKIGRVDIPDDLKDLKKIAYSDLDEAMALFLEKEQVMLQSNGRDLLPGAKMLLERLREK